MAISITRRRAQQLRTVLRRAFGSRGPGPAICFTAAAGTLTVKASGHDVAVAYSEPSDAPAETLWLPSSFLDDCAGKRDDPVHVEATGKGRATAQWRDGSVPQIVQYDSPAPPDADTFPALPEDFVSNPPGLLDAFVAAADTCDPDATRYSLGCIRLRGTDSSMAATDGRQLLIQRGFQFPWTEDILVPRSKVFASADLPRDQPVRIGKSGNWVVIGIGAWTVHMAVNSEGRFPKVEDIVPSVNVATARCSFSEADAAFLVESLPRLPCDDDNYRPITLDLNGRVVVRAKPLDSERPTEVLLNGSSFTGEPIRINSNRDYLRRAMQLGLRELVVTNANAAVLAHDVTRAYVWMILAPESAIKPADDVIRIESPQAEASTSTASTSKPKTERTIKPVSVPITNTSGNGHAASNGQVTSNGHAKANGRAKLSGEARNGTVRKAAHPDIAPLIEQAEKLRTALHDLTRQANGVVKALKQHRRQNRAIQTTLANLRQLKTLGV